MGASSHAAHPSLWERLAFLVKRFARMHQVGANVTYGIENQLPLFGRPLIQVELDQSELIRLSSAVWHLAYGETVSRWSEDSYLERPVRAKPELRQKALEEHGLTEADYDDWLEVYAVPQPIH